MRIVPDSTITLYSNIPITADNDEQLIFSSLAHQAAYFETHKVAEKVRCQMIRKSGRLRINIPATTLKNCNYLSFINPSWDNKTFYCKIKDYNYINNECVDIAYTIDVFQTWLFDVSFSDMYIEREHLSEADFQKAEVNPYDPTIFEFKTSEELPITKDIEKAYYRISDEEIKPEDGYDGFRVGQAIQHKFDVGAPEIGVLLVFPDINFESLSEGSEPIPGFSVAQEFTDTLGSLASDSAGSFYYLSNATYSTLTTLYSSTIPQSDKGSAWTDISGIGNLYPMGASLIKSPNNYIFFSQAASSPGSSDAHALATILKIFTRWYILDNIVGLYCIPEGMMLCSGTAGEYILSASLDSAKTSQNVRNKKLDLFPYSYYRLIAPNGDIKELRMEDFKELQEGRDYATIGLSFDCVASPQLYVGPLDYKMEKGGIGANMNIQETLIFAQFPTLPFSIDGFLAHIAAVANNIIGNNTTEYGFSIAEKQMAAYDQLGTAIKNTTNMIAYASTGNVAEALNAPVNATLAGARYDLMQQEVDFAVQQSERAHDVLRYGSEKNAIADNYQFTKPAYAAAQYHQSDGNGMSNFMLCSYVDVIFMKVSLNPAVLAEYDKYFDNFGYSSGRCGIPRVINYMNGSSTDTELPHWHTINGKDMTYVKTKNCKVEYAMEPVSQGIKTIFDNGVRLIKGD